MNSTSVQVYHEEDGLVSDKDFITIDSALACCMIIISLIGVITNYINIRTFIYMGLDDGITISLFGLALSDFGFSFCGCVMGCAHMLWGLEMMYVIRQLPVAPKHVVDMFAANIGFLFHKITCLTTTFIAIARCMCVAMPFQFKHFFTRTKSASALVIFTLVAISSYVPLLSQMGVQRKFDPQVNKTRFVLWMSGRRSVFKNIIGSFHAIIFAVSFVVVLICICIMAKNLKLSGKFRRTSTVKAGQEKGQYKLSGKELQVVKQVVFICIIYTICLIPGFSMFALRLVVKDFDIGGRLHNIYISLSSAGINLYLINSATSFSVYYMYNSKFRALCCST